MYQALYRKWRPRTFRDVVGQEAITGALTSQIEAGRVGHAYLFTGTRGTGKTTCAKVLAKTVNCETPGEDGPCGICPCCTGIEDGSILDVTEIDAASNNGVDDVRGLRDETVYRPGRCKYKVYIIDEVHMLSMAAFNALLKILEEPPSHVIFILATTEIHKVPATILSRCQRFDFTRIPAGQIKERLLEVAGQEGIELSDGAASLVAVLGDGSMRDALSLLDTCAAFGQVVDEELVRRMAGVTDKSYLFALSDAAAAGGTHEVLALVAGLRERSVDIKRLCEELVAHYRNFLLAAAKPDGSLLDFLPEDEKQKYIENAPKMEGSAVNALQRLATALERMSRSQEPRIELELALFDIASGTAPPAPQATVRPVRAPTVQPAPSAQAVPQDRPAAAQNRVENPVPAGEPALIPPHRTDTIEVARSEPSPEVQSSIPAPSAHGAETPPEAEPRTQATLAASVVPPAAAHTPAPPAASAAAAPTGEIELFERWDEVVAATAKTDPMVYSYLKKSKAYFNGTHILIDGGDVFKEFIRSNKNVADTIKNALKNVTGKRYAIGPYTSKTGGDTPQDTSNKTIEEWKEKGVPIEYENL